MYPIFERNIVELPLTGALRLNYLQISKFVSTNNVDWNKYLNTYNLFKYMVSEPQHSGYCTRMMTSSNENILRFLPLCEWFTGHWWIPPPPPSKGQWRVHLMFSLIYAWINGWVNNREAGDLTRHRTRYDVALIRKFIFSLYMSWSTVARLRQVHSGPHSYDKLGSRLMGPRTYLSYRLQ